MSRIVASLALVLASTAPGGQPAPDIRGVWRPVSRTIPAATNPGERSDPFGHVPAGVQTNLQPGLLMFTAGYYGRITDTATSKRPGGPETVPGQPSLEELQARWGPFQANGGTYEVAGSILTLRILVSKNPTEQHAGAFARIRVRLEGDRLWLTPVENRTGRIAAGVTTEYVRLE